MGTYDILNKWIRPGPAVSDTILAWDTFNRADGALGNSLAYGPARESCPAYAWANHDLTLFFSVEDAAAWIDTTSPAWSVARATIDLSAVAGDVYVTANLTLPDNVNGTEAGIIFRYAAASDEGILVVFGQFAGDTWIFVYELPSWTVLLQLDTPNPFTYRAGGVAGAKIVGRDIYVYYDGALVGSCAYTDPTYDPPGRVGLYGYYYDEFPVNGIYIDNFLVKPA